MPELLASFSGVRKTASGWMAKCPAHADRRASLSISQSNDGTWLMKCHAGCSVDAVLAAVNLELRDLFPRTDSRKRKEAVAHYDYTDASGMLVGQVLRYEPKSFRQRRPDGHGDWIWNMKGVQLPPYRVDSVRNQTVVYIGEGEKDADRLREIGIPATCNAGGAGKWTARHSQQLADAGVAKVVVLPHNDAPGHAHAAAVAKLCLAAGLQSKVVHLPDLPDKGDIVDYLSDHSRQDLFDLVTSTPSYCDDGPSVEPKVPAESLGQTDARQAVFVRLSEVEREEVSWHWYARLVRGKTTIVMGDPGLGKSWLTCDMAARTTVGADWPDEGRAPIGDVIILTAEDGLGDTVRPRIEDLGGGPSAVCMS